MGTRLYPENGTTKFQRLHFALPSEELEDPTIILMPFAWSFREM